MALETNLPQDPPSQRKPELDTKTLASAMKKVLEDLGDKSFKEHFAAAQMHQEGKLKLPEPKMHLSHLHFTDQDLGDLLREIGLIEVNIAPAPPASSRRGRKGGEAAEADKATEPKKERKPKSDAIYERWMLTGHHLPDQEHRTGITCVRDERGGLRIFIQ